MNRRMGILFIWTPCIAYQPVDQRAHHDTSGNLSPALCLPQPSTTRPRHPREPAPRPVSNSALTNLSTKGHSAHPETRWNNAEKGDAVKGILSRGSGLRLFRQSRLHCTRSRVVCGRGLDIRVGPIIYACVWSSGAAI